MNRKSGQSLEIIWMEGCTIKCRWIVHDQLNKKITNKYPHLSNNDHSANPFVMKQLTS